jgi:predicted metal-dependent peptidase
MIQGKGKAKLEKALETIYLKNRFTSYFFQNCEIRNIPNPPPEATAGITTKDGYVFLYYSEDFIEDLTIPQIIGLLMHEMLHVIHGHIKRTTKNFNHDLANRAQDYLINQDIIDNPSKYMQDAKVDLPAGGCFLPDDLKEGWEELTWEALYAIMKKDDRFKEPEKKPLDFKQIAKIADDAKNKKLPGWRCVYDEKNPFTIESDGKGKYTLSVFDPKTKKNSNPITDTADNLEKKYPELKWFLLPYYHIVDVIEMALAGMGKYFTYEQKQGYKLNLQPASSNVDIHLMSYPIHDPAKEIKKPLEDILADFPDREWQPISQGGGGGKGKGGGQGEGEESDEKGEGGGQPNAENVAKPGKGFDSHEGWDEANEAEIERIVNRAEALSKGCGDGSANMIMILENIRKRDTRWADGLKSTVDFLSSSDRQPSWKRFHKRLMAFDIYEKGWATSHMKKLTVGVDTSGSMMGGRTIESCFEVIEGLADRFSLNVVEIDTQIKQVEKYNPGDWKKFKVTGGGGTAFGEFFNKYLVGHKEAVIMLTDGYVETASLKRYDNCIWVVTEPGFDKPFGKKVYINPESIGK